MERPPNPGAINSVTQSIDGATGDITMSGDAMRWSPELAEGQGSAGSLGSGALPGVDVAAGFGALLGLDGPGVRRLVSGAVTSLATVAGDVVAELRQLTRSPEEDDDPADDEVEPDTRPSPPPAPSGP
jgi:hypothetical protein